MYAGAFNTGKMKLEYSGDPITHLRMYWNLPGQSQNLKTFQENELGLEFDISDVFPAPGLYEVRIFASDETSEEWADTGVLAVVADVGHLRLRR